MRSHSEILGLGLQHINGGRRYHRDSAQLYLSSDIVPECLRPLEEDLGSTENQRILQTHLFPKCPIEGCQKGWVCIHSQMRVFGTEGAGPGDLDTYRLELLHLKQAWARAKLCVSPCC